MGKGNSAGLAAGRYVAAIRDAAGITQALLANRVTLSAATLVVRIGREGHHR